MIIPMAIQREAHVLGVNAKGRQYTGGLNSLVISILETEAIRINPHD